MHQQNYENAENKCFNSGQLKWLNILICAKKINKKALILHFKYIRLYQRVVYREEK